MQATAITFPAANRVELAGFTVRDPAEGECMLETLVTCVSPGTELRILTGGQWGQSWPCIPGYCLVGRVVRTRCALAEGQVVFCTGTVDASPITPNGGGHVSHAIIPVANAVPVPDGVDPVEAATCTLAAIALRGVRMSRPRLGETAVVIGLGVIGQFSARLHALAGARTLGIDRAPRRVELLRAAGVEARTSSIAEVAAALPAGVDIVVDATGVPALVPQAITLLKPVPLSDAEQPDTRYLVQGSYAGDIAFPYPEAFRRQVTVLAPKAHQPRDRFAIMELFRQGRLRGRDLVSTLRRPEEAEPTYRELLDPATTLLTAAFQWRA